MTSASFYQTAFPQVIMLSSPNSKFSSISVLGHLLTCFLIHYSVGEEQLPGKVIAKADPTLLNNYW